MVIAGNGGHHAGSLWGGFIFDFTSGQWVSKPNTNGKAETRGEPDDLAVDWSTGELKGQDRSHRSAPDSGPRLHVAILSAEVGERRHQGCVHQAVRRCRLRRGLVTRQRSFQFDLDTGLLDLRIGQQHQLRRQVPEAVHRWWRRLGSGNQPLLHATARAPTPDELRYLEKTATRLDLAQGCLSQACV